MFQKLIPCLILLAISCEQKVGPEGLNYSEDKIVAVMLDMYIASELVNNREEPIKDSLQLTYSGEIEKIHNIELSVFERDIKYIKQDMEWYRDLHKIVSDSLDKLDEIYSKRTKAIKKTKK